MFTKKHRQSLRGLSHQDKVKKLQKLTRVPLQNLKTNIIESDLEQDDISIPISLKQFGTQQKEKSSFIQNNHKANKESNKQNKKMQQYDQQKINRTIRAMTKELYSLEKQKEKSAKIQQIENLQPNISSFSIEQIDLQLQKLNYTKPSQNINISARHKRHQSSFNQYQSTQLTEITLNKFNRQENKSDKNIIRKPQLTRRRQAPTQRQTQPIYYEQAPVYQSIKTFQKLQIPQDINTKRQSSQSNLTKRFSRTKRNTDLQTNCEKDFDSKKFKFNRSSNQKNKCLPPNVNNKENIQNFLQPKKALMTERLSYQQIPTYQTIETTGLKKRRNIGKFFITNNQKNYQYNKHSQNDLQKYTSYPQQNYSKQPLNIKQKTKQQINMFQKISQNELFKQLYFNQNQNDHFDSKEKEFVSGVFRNYRQSIELLKKIL